MNRRYQEGHVMLEQDDEDETYFDNDVKSELVSNKPKKKIDWNQMKKRVRYYVPIFRWLPTYNWRTDFPKDFVAGKTLNIEFKIKDWLFLL